MAKREWMIPLAAALAAVGGCATVPGPDPVVTTSNDQIATQAKTFYATLATKTAPDCAFEANAATYATLKTDAGKLRDHVAGAGEDTALLTAATELDKAVAGAERSHQLASARTDDPSGACLAPDVLTLNADAIARATDAIKQLQQAREAR
ncbi:hypothetical protein M0208_11605 [Sphingomonas sp. SUN019]|uniref:hypothetical protein n=1 Tax=Sphingomonas sp. SUN019 TaxID=2937788 RepID=UPI0021642CF1|nr:hypothetical protein [Sphingomonas sp. SUN019]UVO51135.1 hypothetical protein M0208_11605 [Sphingomonas sp. SUN019]